MSFTIDFTYPYLDEVPLPPPEPEYFPTVLDVTLGGHGYKMNTSFEPYRRQSFRHTSMDATRQAIDYTNIPGEGSVSTDLPWRRTADDWSLGSGQLFADKKLSADNRYHRSKGINPWMQWQATLLPDTKNVFGTDVEVKAIAAANYVYILTDARVVFTSDYVHYITLEGLPVSGLADICTDGDNVYIAAQDNGIYIATIGDLGGAQYLTGTVNTIAFVGNNLMAAFGPNLWNVLGNQAATGGVGLLTSTGGNWWNPLYTHPIGSWVWNAFCYGSSQIYISGSATGAQAGGIYRTTAESTGTALTVPVLALPLENGEVCHAMHTYINFVFIGTDLGLRMCETLAAYDPTGNEGDLRSGPLIPNITQPVTYPVTGITGNNRWVWFAWSYYDSENSGIGRADISNFIDTLAPAYASDLMVPRGPIRFLDWCPITNGPLISVTGKGVYTQASTLVAQGTIDSGAITYGIPDDKIMEFFSIRSATPEQPGDIIISIGADGGTPALVGAQYENQGVSYSKFPLGQIRGECVTVQTTLRANAAQTAGPTLWRETLEAIPAVVAPTTISIVIILYSQVAAGTQTISSDVYAELAFLENLRLTQQVVTYQEGLDFSAQVVVTGLDWLPAHERDTDRGGFDVDCVVYLKTIEA